ncbi:MAG: hypothetical protein EGR81_05835 [Ruminococcaceae bacterium]|nr:hypothetical protein [Oscillospiraceae bacterium]
MGGRGQNYSIQKRLNNHKNAVIARNKLKNYILNPTKDESKAKFFKSLGYNMQNYERLERDMRAKLGTSKALKYQTNPDGSVSFQVNMYIGIDKKALVTTAWRIDNGSNVPRFITAYPNRSKRVGR